MESLSAVGRTAVGVASIRAAESARPDRLFCDPYASAFVAAFPGVEPTPRPPGSVAAALAFQVRIRTRFFDEYLLGTGLRQVVLLAAGLDTRAYRLDWAAGTRMFEVDRPDVLSVKARVLDAGGAVPRAARTVVAADLRGDWAAALADAGFVAGEPTAWLVEGLLAYLTPADAARVMTTVGSLSSPGSQVALEGGAGAAALAARGGYETVTSLFRGGLGEDTAAWLNAHGWTAVSHPLAPVAAAYGRPLTSPSSAAFVTATRP